MYFVDLQNLENNDINKDHDDNLCKRWHRYKYFQKFKKYADIQVMPCEMHVDKWFQKVTAGTRLPGDS